MASVDPRTPKGNGQHVRKHLLESRSPYEGWSLLRQLHVGASARMHISGSG
jgi:hypothetical protein